MIETWPTRLADPLLRDTPVVVISASGFARETIGQQAQDVFSKPLDLDRFLETLRALCGGDDAGQSPSTTKAEG